MNLSRKDLIALQCSAEICYVVLVSTLSLLTLSLSVFVFVPGLPVQENERNSSEDRSTRHPDGDPTRFTNTAPVGQERMMGTEEGRGHVYNSLEWSSAPLSVSSASSQDQGLLNPTSPMQGLPVAGRTDRETLPLPEEKPNNGPEKSGAAHRTDGPMTARETAHTYFQNALSTDTNSNTPSNPTEKGLHTHMALTDASSSDVLLGADIQEYTSAQTSKNTKKDVATQLDQSMSSSVIPILTSSPPELPSSWMGHTVITAHAGAVTRTSGDTHSWRSQRSTDRHNSDLTFAITSDPLKSSIKPLKDDLISAQTHNEPTSSSSEVPSGTRSSNIRITELDTADGAAEADTVHPNRSQSNSFATVASAVTAQTLTSELLDKVEHREVTPPPSPQSQTDSPQSTESSTHSVYRPPSFTQTDKEAQTAVESTQRYFIGTHTTGNAIPLSSGTTKAYDWTTGFTVFSSTPGAAPTTGGAAENSAVTASTGATSALYPARTTLRDSSLADSPTAVPLSSSTTSTDSSTPSYTLQTHSMFVDSSQPTLTTSVSQSTVHTILFNSKTTPSPPEMSPRTRSHLPLPTSTNKIPTHKAFQKILTITLSPLPSTMTSNYGDGEAKVEEDRFWQWSSSNTATHTPTTGPSLQIPRQTTTPPSQENSSASTTTPPRSSTNSPKLYIVPDQPAAIRGTSQTALKCFSL